MSDHHEVKQLAHKDGIFDVSVGYFYEDIHPEDLFDNSIDPDTGKPYYDTDLMAKRIDSYQDAWFGFWVKYYYQGHEVGYANLGGLYYKDNDAESVIIEQAKTNDDCWYKDVMDEAKDQAMKDLRHLYNQMKLDLEGVNA